MVLDRRAAIGIGPRYVGISCVVLTVHLKSAGVLLCIRCLIPWFWKGGDCIGQWYVGISLIVDARSLVCRRQTLYTYQARATRSPNSESPITNGWIG
jgi:hypothetical protein